MGDVAGGDIARRRWMEKDAGRKQQCIGMESKKCGNLVIFSSTFFDNNSLKDSSNQQHSDNILRIPFHILILYLCNYPF